MRYPEHFLSPCSDRYEAMEAGWMLLAELRDKYPSVVMWSGSTLTRPYAVLIRAGQEIECPEVYTTEDGYDFDVQLLVLED